MGELDLYVGPLVIGIVLNLLLYGVMVVQTFEYYLGCGKDPRWVKWLVASLFIADTINSSINFADIHYILVSGFGNFEKVNALNWMGDFDPGFTSVISAVVQIFYAYRILRLSQNKWIAGFIVTIALTQAAAGVAATISLMLATSNSIRDLRIIRTEAIIWLALSAVTDVIITATLVRFLRENRTGFEATDDLISKIVRTTVQTGLITSIWTTMALTLYLALDNNIELAFSFPLCKVYTNTLLSSLNTRPLGDPRTSNESGSLVALTSIRFKHPETMRGTVYTEANDIIDATWSEQNAPQPDSLHADRELLGDYDEMPSITPAFVTQYSTGSTPVDDGQAVSVDNQTNFV